MENNNKRSNAGADDTVNEKKKEKKTDAEKIEHIIKESNFGKSILKSVEELRNIVNAITIETSDQTKVINELVEKHNLTASKIAEIVEFLNKISGNTRRETKNPGGTNAEDNAHTEQQYTEAGNNTDSRVAGSDHQIPNPLLMDKTQVIEAVANKNMPWYAPLLISVCNVVVGSLPRIVQSLPAIVASSSNQRATVPQEDPIGALTRRLQEMNDLKNSISKFVGGERKAVMEELSTTINFVKGLMSVSKTFEKLPAVKSDENSGKRIQAEESVTDESDIAQTGGYRF